jgi:dipicolinate synthase subunit B
MAAKAHLRNERPVVLAIATNDALAANARNLGELLNRRNIYFVPFYQDDPLKKPRSLQADFDKINDTIISAWQGRQLQPIFAVK